LYADLSQENQWRRRAEEEVRTLNSELEQRVIERTRELSEAQQRLTEMAHQAGMAEIATSILHNVGNVLNSVNVSTAHLAEQITRSRVPNVRRFAKLLEEQQGDLSSFFANDPRGQQLPGFAKVLADQLDQERERNVEELERVRKHIETIRKIVTLQQSFAGGPRFMTAVQVPELLEDALSISGISTGNREYTIVRDYTPLPGPCRLEKHRVLQIFINLLTNADYALRNAPKDLDRTLTLRVRPEGEDDVCVEVADNGSGIAPEALPRLFTFGFTTRPEGHGFGLHFCAVEAQAMRGKIQAQSDGVGKGATFTLIIPREGATEA
jgi:C4-dicarboxylate-specific signal transduction histidine kinase